MTTTPAADAVRQEPEPITLAEFLEAVPPGTSVQVRGLAVERKSQFGVPLGNQFAAPDIQLHCGSETCNRLLFFRRTGDFPPDLDEGQWKFFYIRYLCSNCRKVEKTFSLAAQLSDDAETGKCYKFGEMPEYGPPTASRLISLIGPDRDLFLKGRRSENQGLGVGAFAYYRRVVENQKNRILDEIIKVAEKIGGSTEVIGELRAAKQETQFSKAVSNIKHSIPQTLLINGHNPLTLLHSALSDGLHDRSDEHCLELANSIRIVLAELSERLSQALKDEAELNRALSKLMGPKTIP